MTIVRLGVVVLAGVCSVSALAQGPDARPRARDLGLAPGVFAPGPLNAITDVERRDGRPRDAHRPARPCAPASRRSCRTAATCSQDKVAGAVFVGNAFGKLAGSTQVDELGTIETPIVLTNTLAVGAAVEGVVRWTLAQRRQRQRPLGERARRRDQ